jgi:hypothetical protein
VRDLDFSEREFLPLLVASEVARPTWRLADRGPPPPMSAVHRARLLAECDTLIESLDGAPAQRKLRAVIADVERFRDSLRSRT